jgi:hypothetical protein
MKMKGSGILDSILLAKLLACVERRRVYSGVDSVMVDDVMVNMWLESASALQQWNGGRRVGRT